MAEVIKYIWLTVGDKNVCPECQRNESEPEKTLEEWEDFGTPSNYPTSCGDRCRCSIVPSSIFEEGQALIDDFVDQIGIQVDLATGREIRLTDYENFKGILTLPYTTMAKMENLIVKWKNKNDLAPLPKEFFEISDIEKMIGWLERELR